MANRKLSLSLIALASVISISLLGTIAGSLAWYAYSQNVTLSYVGTSVSNSSLLNVGLIDNGTTRIFSDNDLVTYNLERKDVTENNQTTSIVFSKSRHGFPLLALQQYLSHTQSAVTTLYPVTTNERALNATGDLTLYKSPEYAETSFNTVADLTDYVTLPFAFRVLGDNSEYIGNKSIWLTETTVQAERGLEDSIRIHVDGENKFLMKPADQEVRKGTTKVGGVLDLDGDGYYDYSGVYNTEYCYGKFNGSTGTADPLQPGDEGYDSLADVNGTNAEAASTFYAKHKPGVRTATFTPLEAEYYSFGKVAPKEDGEGNYYEDTEHDEGKAIAVTSSTTGIAYATFKIFIEGWDHSVIDRAAGYSFTLELRFEVDRA